MRLMSACVALAGLVWACSSSAALDGLVAFSFEGDIYVGDLATGEAEQVTDGAESDINPMFSPDGTRIAFVRGTPIWGASSLIVTSVSGTDEVVVVPEGFSGRPGGGGVGPFAWTPDGTALVVEIDSPPHERGHHDGELTMFDADGGPDSTLLVPPLNAAVGAIYFNPSARVAPMFQPPSGDLILNPRDGRVEIYDSDLKLVDRIDVESKTQISLGLDSGLVWSPDGSLILVSGTSYDGETDTWIYRDSVVVDAETGEIQEFLGQIQSGTWSPNSTYIAYEDWDSENPPTEARIAVHELATGEVRILESSLSPLKRGASVQTITNNKDHDWYYEGWSWSPDSQLLIILQDHNTRPLVINVATDTVTELPWITDSFPSWQPNT